MLTDGVTARQNDGLASENVEVVDVAQLLLSSVKRTPAKAVPVGAPEIGGEAEADGKADVPTDEAPSGTPQAEEDKQ